MCEEDSQRGVVTMNRVLIVGGGEEGLFWAKRCGAVHVDRYLHVDPAAVEGGVQVHVEDFSLLPVVFGDVERVYVYVDVLEAVGELPWEVVVVAPGGSPACVRYRCVERPCL